MAIVRREGSSLAPYRPSLFENRFGSLAENMFEDMLSQFLPFASQGAAGQGEGIAGPRLDIVETDKTFQIEAEMPGVKKEDLKISVDNRRVTIEADTNRASERKEGESVVYAERTTRRYARSITLPVDVADDGAQARFENGVLMLSLPKKEPAQPKKITVQ
jgi:HSP20 family protein